MSVHKNNFIFLFLFLFFVFSLVSSVHSQSLRVSSDVRNHLSIDSSASNLTREIRLGLNKSIVLDIPADAHDILVANPGVADAVMRTSRRIYLFGKKIGQTNIFVFDNFGDQIVSLELLIERDISGLESTIRRLIPDSNVSAEMINDNMVLTGTVPTPQAAATAVRLAQVFVRGGEQTEDDGDTGDNTNVLVIDDSNDEDRESDIVNLLRIDGEDQVHLKVVIAEVQRSVVKQLGLNTTIANGQNDGFGFGINGGGVNLLSTAPGIGGGLLNINDTATGFNSLYRALEANGVMRTLAEPSLSAISGEKAHFRAGGTYYLPDSIVQDEEEGTEVTFQQVDYGVALTFTPVVLSEGRISLKVRAEVSEPTTEGGTAVFDAVNYIGLRRRLADTTVELPSGGSMVIGGLLQDDVRQAINGHPGLKDIPFFGPLFRSREFIRNESEVIVIITPYLIRPVPRSSLKRPDEGFEPSSDSVGYFLGRINRVYGIKSGTIPPGRYSGNIGFIIK